MTRAELEHVIRAASTITDETEIVVVGSQSILGRYPDAPATLRVSMEADVYPRRAPEKAALIEGSIGEGSMFEETFGYYAQGVGPETSVLPRGWEDRLVRIENANTRGAVGLALDPHDLAVAKYVANREKDREFLREAIRTHLIDPAVVRERLALAPVATERLASMLAALASDVG